jgi:hypothetical protein
LIVFPGHAPPGRGNKAKKGSFLNKGGIYAIKWGFQRSDLDAETKKTPDFRPPLVRGCSARVPFVKGLLAFYLVVHPARELTPVVGRRKGVPFAAREVHP